MSLIDDLRAQIAEETGFWGGDDPVVHVMLRALTLAEAVENLPEAAGWIRYAEGVYVPAHRVQAAAVEKLKEMIK